MEQLANMEGSGLIPLLVDSKYEDLQRMYNLFKRVEGGLDLLRKMMGAHITSQGLALVQDPEKVSHCTLTAAAWHHWPAWDRLGLLGCH
jgi:cullin 3